MTPSRRLDGEIHVARDAGDASSEVKEAAAVAGRIARRETEAIKRRRDRAQPEPFEAVEPEPQPVGFEAGPEPEVLIPGSGGRMIGPPEGRQ